MFIVTNELKLPIDLVDSFIFGARTEMDAIAFVSPRECDKEKVPLLPTSASTKDSL
jgi:hypothetical protein